ncbi:DUF3826 domain-containing protein [Aridibaculum aurantiacum]|uniref:DUF3826 domain-containing protein n=1 Tax=Aridibaculum aurantiacum TaxID=2810307 RepID=UPI001A95ECA8
MAFSQDHLNGNGTTSTAANRAKQLVDALGINDLEKRSRTNAIINRHLDSLEVIFKDRAKAVESAGKAETKELSNFRGRSAWDAANGRLNKVHAVFLGRLSTELTAEQIETLKNAMTENGMIREYNNYLDLFPNLASYQKEQLMAYLREARDNAMNAETAGQRKEWFIKYRGRANNFLSAAGYDLRKATDEQQKRKANKSKEQ